MDYAKQLAEGTSIRKSAAAVGIHPNTAFRWRHRFLSLPNGQQAICAALAAVAKEMGITHRPVSLADGQRVVVLTAPRQRRQRRSAVSHRKNTGLSFR